MVTLAFLVCKVAFGDQLTRQQLDKAVAYAEANQSQALIISQNGKILVEKYFDGYDKNSPHMLASGSKTFLGLTALAAVDEGKLNLDDHARKYFPEWANDRQKSKITVRQLLTMSSGVEAGKFSENRKGEPGWQELTTKPMEAEPGTKYHYGPVHINLGAYVVEKALKNESFEGYLKRKILDPLGIQVSWRMRYQDGHPQVAGGAFMTAPDWIKLGEMLRQKGVYQGKRILSEAAVKSLVQPSATNANYGLTCWLVPDGEKVMSNSDRRALPSWAPSDFFMAAGMGKQRLYIVPSRGIVAVRFGKGLSVRYKDDGVLEPLLNL